jgi:hypothetical protein
MCLLFLFCLPTCSSLETKPEDLFTQGFQDTFFNIKIVLPKNWILEFDDRENTLPKMEDWQIRILNLESTIYIDGVLFESEDELVEGFDLRQDSLQRVKEYGIIGEEQFSSSKVEICWKEYQYYEYTRHEGENDLGPFVRVIYVPFNNDLVLYDVRLYIYEEEFEQLDQLKSDFWAFISRIECE